jgi:LmbE family N-acetylglucosaminyl deacetylase/CheY-like chemotaxis protein
MPSGRTWTIVAARRGRLIDFDGLDAPLRASPASAVAAERTSTPAQILVVEDDPVIATLVSRLLESLGDVAVARTGEEAAALAPTKDWDLVVSDVELGGMTGIELIQLVKRTRSSVASLIISAHDSFEYAVAALRAGADDYMTKPIEPQAIVAKARELIDLSRQRRATPREVVLAIGAHPDDVEIGVGGILLRHVAEGHDVTVLTLTSGEAGGVAEDRAKESAQAARILGARLVHSDLRDTGVSEGASTIAQIQRVLEETGATTVYTHTPRDVHQDHRNVHQATLVAARKVPRIYCYQAPSTTVDFHPTRFVAIDEYLERKLEVIHAYGSQVKVRRYLEEDLLRATARYWSRFSQARYVEPLEVVRESDVQQPAAHTGGTTGSPQEATLGAV